MFYETRENKHGLRHDPFKALAVPRPIGWISSLDRNGVCNLAPYSFFNAIGERLEGVVAQAVLVVARFVEQGACLLGKMARDRSTSRRSREVNLG